MFKHYRNLTRGLLCPCVTHNPGYIRIQSTACEQKRWGQIITDLDHDFLFNLASGNVCVVHDRSEQARETRACWQGLSWIRSACHRAWEPTRPPSEFSRGGMDISKFWEDAYLRLDEQPLRKLQYFRQFHRPGNIIMTYSCWVPPFAVNREQTNEVVNATVVEAVTH